MKTSALCASLALLLSLGLAAAADAAPWCSTYCSCSTECFTQCWNENGPSACIEYICNDFCLGSPALPDDKVATPEDLLAALFEGSTPQTAAAETAVAP